MNPSSRPRLPEPSLPFPEEVAEGRASESTTGARGPASEHYWDLCPNCGARLVSQRCKFTCPRCHYFMSCSDFD